MRIRRPSPALVVASIAIIIATAGTAFAATGQLVNITDPGNAAQAAKVDATGKLNVGDGSGALSVDGTTTSHEAAPSALFRGQAFPFTGAGCIPLATPPAGKALILKSLALDTFTIGTPGAGILASFYLGTNGCERFVMDINPPGVGLINQPFEPGLGVPAGQRLWVSANGISSEAFAFGYVTTASSVPPSSGTTVAAKARSPQR
jgi:hypothetical protein